jgi:hypothetical protein
MIFNSINRLYGILDTPCDLWQNSKVISIRRALISYGSTAENKISRLKQIPFSESTTTFIYQPGTQSEYYAHHYPMNTFNHRPQAISDLSVSSQKILSLAEL